MPDRHTSRAAENGKRKVTRNEHGKYSRKSSTRQHGGTSTCDFEAPSVGSSPTDKTYAAVADVVIATD